MKVSGSQDIEVELDKQEMATVADHVLKEIFQLSNARMYFHYIEKDNLMLCVEQSAGSHSYDERTIVRKATAEDRAALLVMDKIEKWRYGK